jgi:hypothetical protein
MAEQVDEKAKAAEQADLFGELEKNDVQVADDAAEKMKENIMTDKGGGGNYLGIGIHDVAVSSVELVKASTGTLGIQFNVENEDGQGRVRMWLSEAALPYTIENISRLVVHNAEGDKKDAARTMMANIVSAKSLFETVQAILVELEKKKKPFVAYLSIREARDGSTYNDKNGVERPSTESNLLSYRPKETSTQAAIAATGGELVADKDTINGLSF